MALNRIEGFRYRLTALSKAVGQGTHWYFCPILL